MALGNQDLKYINTKVVNLRSLNSQLKDCLNTFQYVTKSLDEWADETIIGEKTKANSQKLSEALKQISDQIEELQSRVSDFEQKQRAINK